jgi:hypothetical protein
MVAVAIAATAFLAEPALGANDLGLTVDSVRVESGTLRIDYDVAEPFTPQLEETLLRGMPATIGIEIGLWKKRSFWFDKLVLAIHSEHKVVHDLWTRSFRVLTGSAPPERRIATSLDSLRAMLFTARDIPVATAADLEPAGSYYVSVRVRIQPVDTEDLGEIERWLSGESNDPRRAEQGLPRYLLGLAVAFSGLGERTAIVKSERFKPEELP